MKKLPTLSEEEISMSQETWDIVVSKKIEEAELQLALQCAPLIAGLKVSNLLNIRVSDYEAVREIIQDCDISWHVLLRLKDKITILLYHEESLKQYLNHHEVKKIFMEAGYISTELKDVLPEFCVRYQSYMVRKEGFPHEMGLLLGYPVEDVTGFINNNGEHSLCTGYWKVYGDKEKKLRLFESYENAKECIIHLLSREVSMADIVHVCCRDMEIKYA